MKSLETQATVFDSETSRVKKPSVALQKVRSGPVFALRSVHHEDHTMDLDGVVEELPQMPPAEPSAEWSLKWNVCQGDTNIYQPTMGLLELCMVTFGYGSEFSTNWPEICESQGLRMAVLQPPNTHIFLSGPHKLWHQKKQPFKKTKRLTYIPQQSKTHQDIEMVSGRRLKHGIICFEQPRLTWK